MAKPRRQGLQPQGHGKKPFPVGTGAEATRPATGPEPAPTLLSLALTQTWLCVYSLLNVCVSRRKHCGGANA